MHDYGLIGLTDSTLCYYRNGYADVVNYLLKAGHVKATMKDLDGKGLLFTAVMHNQPKVLKYLLSHVRHHQTCKFFERFLYGYQQYHGRCN